MRRYVPTEVVDYIDHALAYVPKDEPPHAQSFSVSREIRAALLGLVEISERVPEHLMIDTEALTDIILSVQAIRTVVREAEAQDIRAQYVALPELRPLPPNQWNPVIVLRNAFARCHDDAPAPHNERLPFIADNLLRRSLETDLDGLDRALGGGEWKAATVLGGSIVEALLLWAIEQKPGPELQGAIERAVKTGTLKKNSGTDPEKWHLPDYIAVASELRLIKSDTATQARLLTGFRNLIHPGRAARTGQACSRGTAHAAQAAIEFVIGDLR